VSVIPAVMMMMMMMMITTMMITTNTTIFLFLVISTTTLPTTPNLCHVLSGGDYHTLACRDGRVLLACAYHREYRRGFIPGTSRPIPGFERPWLPEGPKVRKTIIVIIVFFIFIFIITIIIIIIIIIIITIIIIIVTIPRPQQVLRVLDVATGADLYTGEMPEDVEGGLLLHELASGPVVVTRWQGDGHLSTIALDGSSKELWASKVRTPDLAGKTRIEIYQTWPRP
jgi:hypothetical protein